MLKSFLLSLAFMASGYVASAQNADSLALVKAKWQKQRIAPKTRLFTYHFTQNGLFQANEQLSFIEIKNRKRAPIFALGYETQALKTTPTFGKANQAIAAINGTFFDVKNGGSVDFIKVNGAVISPNRLDKSGKRARHQQAAVVISNGKLGLKKWDGTSNWEEKLTENDVMLTGPLLLFNQAEENLDTAAFNRLRHPRSAIGLKPDGTVLLLTVDGRHENSAGMSLFELTKTMKWLGCTSAINLDGGGSTTLWLADAPGNGIVNFPSDNKKWDHEGERKVANVILLKPRK